MRDDANRYPRASIYKYSTSAVLYTEDSIQVTSSAKGWRGRSVFCTNIWLVLIDLQCTAESVMKLIKYWFDQSPITIINHCKSGVVCVVNNSIHCDYVSSSWKSFQLRF